MTDNTPVEYSSIRILLDRSICTRIDVLNDEIQRFSVPEFCLHDSIVTGALASIGMKDMYVGREPDRILIEETVEAISSYSSPTVEKECLRTFVLPWGKVRILQAISAECGRTIYPEESEVMTGLFTIGLEEIETDFKPSSVLWNSENAGQPTKGFQP